MIRQQKTRQIYDKTFIGFDPTGQECKEQATLQYMTTCRYIKEKINDFTLGLKMDDYEWKNRQNKMVKLLP
jgi:hypothetical protein